MKTSGFSFIHDGLSGGYPFVEAIWSIWPYVDEMVIVDMQSTDGTREVLRRLGVEIIDGEWGNKAGETLAAAHALNKECSGDIIVHFEADEVYDKKLVERIRELIYTGIHDISVHRLQLEQNFQRCRWYPEAVHRVFPKGSVVKSGHTTSRHGQTTVLGPEEGYLWDITNCFRDNWLNRIKAQAELWDQPANNQMVSLHAFQPLKLDDWQIPAALNEPHWTWTSTPFDIPAILRPLVGRTRYEVNL